MECRRSICLCHNLPGHKVSPGDTARWSTLKAPDKNPESQDPTEAAKFRTFKRICMWFMFNKGPSSQSHAPLRAVYKQYLHPKVTLTVYTAPHRLNTVITPTPKLRKRALKFFNCSSICVVSRGMITEHTWTKIFCQEIRQSPRNQISVIAQFW